VPGAHEGKGMGNQFLNDLSQADVFVHVIDIAGSTNEKGESVPAGSYDPARDVEFLEVELDMWYIGILKNAWQKFVRLASQEGKSPKKAIAQHFSGLGRVTEGMVEVILKKFKLLDVALTDWSDRSIEDFARELRRETKPMIIACNKIDVAGAHENFLRLCEKFPDRMFVACSAESELALREAAKHELIKYIPGAGDFEVVGSLSERQKKGLEFVRANILGKFSNTGVQQVLDAAVFELLKYKVVFPGGVNNLVDKHGNVLPDSFLLPPGSTALDFAFRIHTDIGKNYVKAINVKTKLPLAKEYELKNRDVIEIKTSK
jgi:ribosome-binding ATPase YchF (GTP1/OBG family)